MKQKLFLHPPHIRLTLYTEKLFRIRQTSIFINNNKRFSINSEFW